MGADALREHELPHAAGFSPLQRWDRAQKRETLGAEPGAPIIGCMVSSTEIPNARRRRLSGPERERLVFEAQARPELSAAELAELAARYGVKLRWVEHLLREAGTPRPRHPAPPPNARERARMARLYSQEPNVSAVARKTGRGYKTVRIVLAEMGLLRKGRTGTPC